MQRGRGAAVEADHMAMSRGAWRPRPQHASLFGQFLELVAGVGVGKVGAELGQIWTDLDLGPKMKFVHLGLLYIFH